MEYLVDRTVNWVAITGFECVVSEGEMGNGKHNQSSGSSALRQGWAIAAREHRKLGNLVS
jgi:hypothetical protein